MTGMHRPTPMNIPTSLDPLLRSRMVCGQAHSTGHLRMVIFPLGLIHGYVEEVGDVGCGVQGMQCIV